MKIGNLVGCALIAFGVAMPSYATPFNLTLANDQTFDGLKPSTFYGWVENGTGQPIGYITCKVGKPNQAALHKVSASVTLLGQKSKLSFSGNLPKNMDTALDEIEGVLISKIGARLELYYITQLELRGQLTLGSAAYLVKGVRDFSADKYDTRKTLLQQYQGDYVFAPQIIAPTSGKFYGSIGLTVKVNAKGVAKVNGVLPDGNKFSVSTRLLLDDTGAHLPLFGQLYGKIGGFGGYIFNMDTFLSDTGSTGFWDGTGAKTVCGGDVWYGRYNTVPVGGRVSNSTMPSAGMHSNETFMVINTGGGALAPLKGAEYKDFFGLEINRDMLPSPLNMTFAGKKFTPVAVNPSNFKLSYVLKTGVLKGSCKIMTTSSKAFNAKINGIWINGYGWINATTKEKGCVGMLVE